MNRDRLVSLIVAVALVHGEHGFDRDRHRAAGDRGRYRRQSAGAEARDYVLSSLARDFHSGQRLGGGPFRHPDGFPRRHRGLRSRLRRLRHGGLACRFRRRAHGAGHRRGDDDTRGPPHPSSHHRPPRAAQRHGLGDHAGTDRTDGRPADRRLHHHLCFLALDLSDQPADRNHRHRAGDALHR